MLKIPLAELSALLGKYQKDAMETSLVTEPRKDLLIRSCGLVGEFGELISVQTADDEHSERGDVLWYVMADLDVLKMNAGSPLFINSIHPQAEFYDFPDQAEKGQHYAGGVPEFRSVIRALAYVAEFAKKVGGHGRDKPIEKTIRALGHITYWVIRNLNSNDLASILAGNISKLRARHSSGKFDPNYGKPGELAVMKETPIPIPVQPMAVCDVCLTTRPVLDMEHVSGGLWMCKGPCVPGAVK